MRLDTSNLPTVARGCALLGAGGGGDPDLPLIMALRAVEENGPVAVVRLEDLPADALIMPCGLIGSPTVAQESIFGGDEGNLLRAAVERLRGEPVAALMPYEIGGANGLLPVTWASRTGLPVVDADGRGRAFPELQQQAMHLAGIPAGPVVLTDGRGNTVVLHATDDAWAERLARGAASSMGGVCAGAVYCMTGAQARSAAVPRSLSLALTLGGSMTGWDSGRLRAAVRAALGAVVLIEGRLVDVEREADSGFVRGSATVQGVGRDAARQLRLEMQNEFLLAVEDGAVRAAVPDIISVLASDTGEPVPTDGLRHGRRITVIALAAPSVWRSEAGLAVAGPAAFGYDVDYTPFAGGAGHGRA